MVGAGDLQVPGHISAWRDTANVRRAVRRQIDALRAADPVGFVRYSTDPLGALHERPDIRVKLTQTFAHVGCSVHAYYDAQVSLPEIVVLDTGGGRRRNFSLLHEFGHHLQQADRAWAFDVLANLGSDRWTVEERVCDLFAAQMLLPEELVAPHATNGRELQARSIVELFHASAASRSACCVHMCGMPGDHAVMLTDLDGTIFFATSSDAFYAPMRGTPQPDLEILIETAIENDGHASGDAHNGLRYGTGRFRQDVYFDIAVDGNWAFVVAKATAGRKGEQAWDLPDHDCDHCLQSHPPSEISRACQLCSTPVCPRCGSCRCPKRSAYCTECFLALSLSEQDAGRTEHVDCP